MSDKTIEEETRRQIARFLPDAIARALTSYFAFSQENPEEKESKKFAAHHTAAKAAIAHVELLIKLAKWADLPDATAEDHNRQIVLAAMVQEAENELETYKENNRENE